MRSDREDQKKFWKCFSSPGEVIRLHDACLGTASIMIEVLRAQEASSPATVGGRNRHVTDHGFLARAFICPLFGSSSSTSMMSHVKDT